MGGIKGNLSLAEAKKEFFLFQVFLMVKELPPTPGVLSFQVIPNILKNTQFYAYKYPIFKNIQLKIYYTQKYTISQYTFTNGNSDKSAFTGGLCLTDLFLFFPVLFFPSKSRALFKVSAHKTPINNELGSGEGHGL